jgi:hypothetical protein
MIRKEQNIMSIVRYVNKKTGVVSLYESTSHYDPETKQSRPVRKYLGREDPVTGELIPSTGKRGRKSEAKSNDAATADTNETLRKELASLRKELADKDSRIISLEEECHKYRAVIDAIAELSSTAGNK